jgi:hypothetical protein
MPWVPPEIALLDDLHSSALPRRISRPLATGQRPRTGHRTSCSSGANPPVLSSPTLCFYLSLVSPPNSLSPWLPISLFLCISLPLSTDLPLSVSLSLFHSFSLPIFPSRIHFLPLSHRVSVKKKNRRRKNEKEEGRRRREEEIIKEEDNLLCKLFFFLFFQLVD